MPIKFITGNFLDSTAKYLFVFCNCIETTTNEFEPQVTTVYNKYPHANLYKEREISGKKSKPGSIEIKGNGNSERFVINILSQFYAGSNNFPNDNNQRRQQWLKKALIQISGLNHLDSIAIDGQMIEDICSKEANGKGGSSFSPSAEEKIIKDVQSYIEIFDDFDKTLQLKVQSPVNITIYNSRHNLPNGDDISLVNKKKPMIAIVPIGQKKSPFPTFVTTLAESTKFNHVMKGRTGIMENEEERGDKAEQGTKEPLVTEEQEIKEPKEIKETKEIKTKETKKTRQK